MALTIFGQGHLDHLSLHLPRMLFLETTLMVAVMTFFLSVMIDQPTFG